MKKWMTEEQALAAIDTVDLVEADGDNDRDLIARGKVKAAIRAIPAPEPVGEDELVEDALAAASYVIVSKHKMPMVPMYAEAVRAALSVVNAHRRREADEVRDALKRVLADLDLAYDHAVNCKHTASDVEVLAAFLAGATKDIRDAIAAKVKP